MNQETYNEAKELQDKISQCRADIKNLHEALNADPQPPIRFGGHYNVSAPIVIQPFTFGSMVGEIMNDKRKELEALLAQFEKL